MLMCASSFLWFSAGVAAGAPLWLALVFWLSRRTWRTARKLSTRSKKHEHLVELGQLVGGLAHEIKNPLSTISLNLQLLGEDLRLEDDETHRRLLRRLSSVQEETVRVRDILEDFLRFAGKIELSLQVVDLGRLIEELVDFFSPQADTARIILRTSIGPEPVRCSVDPDLVKQAILNLLLNAVQAMKEGGELLVRLTGARGKAIIEVIDTGPGIGKDDLEKIFNIYYSTKERGTGLGLPTTRRIIRELDGTIRVESEVGKGTRFVITLPAAK
jgi:signal transduction histidine kinase